MALAEKCSQGFLQLVLGLMNSFLGICAELWETLDWASRVQWPYTFLRDSYHMLCRHEKGALGLFFFGVNLYNLPPGQRRQTHTRWLDAGIRLDCRLMNIQNCPTGVVLAPCIQQGHCAGATWLSWQKLSSTGLTPVCNLFTAVKCLLPDKCK